MGAEIEELTFRSFRARDRCGDVGRTAHPRPERRAAYSLVGRAHPSGSCFRPKNGTEPSAPCRFRWRTHGGTSCRTTTGESPFRRKDAKSLPSATPTLVDMIVSRMSNPIRSSSDARAFTCASNPVRRPTLRRTRRDLPPLPPISDLDGRSAFWDRGMGSTPTELY